MELKKIIVYMLVVHSCLIIKPGDVEAACPGEMVEIIAHAESDMDLDCSGLIYALSGKSIWGKNNEEVRPYFTGGEKLKIRIAEGCENLEISIVDSQTANISEFPAIESDGASSVLWVKSGERRRTLTYREDSRSEIKVELFPAEIIISGTARDVRKGFVFESHFGIPSMEKFNVNMNYQSPSCVLKR